MKQLIARVDDDLHRRLKERAQEEGRSMNAVVVDALQRLVEKPPTAREAMRRRLREAGLLVERGDVPRDAEGPSRDEVIEMWRGHGRELLDALEWVRGER